MTFLEFIQKLKILTLVKKIEELEKENEKNKALAAYYKGFHDGKHLFR